MNYQVNDTVMYGTNGVCKITDITEQDFCGEVTEYYILKPVYDQRSTIFVPVDSAALTAKMRHVLSIDEIYELIRTMPDEESIWIDNESNRKTSYKELLENGDRHDLVKLIKTLYLHQQKQSERGKKLHISDERFLRDAEKILYDEFAIVLKIDPDQVLPFLIEQIQLDEKAK